MVKAELRAKPTNSGARNMMKMTATGC